MCSGSAPFDNPDWRSENESDGPVFYGYDDDSGRTAWYSEDGSLDSETATPDLDDLSVERGIYDGSLEDLSGHD